MRHFRTAPRAVEGLHAAAHQVHVKGPVKPTAVCHYGTCGVQAAGVLTGGNRETYTKTHMASCEENEGIILNETLDLRQYCVIIKVNLSMNLIRFL